MPFLIDGHNLISHLDDLELSDPHDEAKLVVKLKGFSARTRKKCTVVFDKGLPGGTSGMSSFSVKVVFASAIDTDADTIIKQRITKITDASNWTVVSSDNEVLWAAERAGMRPMRCGRFAELLNRPPKARPHQGINENVMVSKQEVEEWLEIFGLSDDDELVDSPPPSETRPKKQTRIQPRSQQATTETPAQPQAKADLPQVNPKDATNARSHVSDAQVDEWLDIFGAGDDDTEQRKPTDKAKRIMPRGGKKKRPKKSAPNEPYVDPRMGDSDDVHVGNNSVEAWLQMFGEGDKEREPTDPAPQRSDPKKQGRFKDSKGKRQPNVHKRMATSDDLYLSDGEVDAWMDLFGADDED